MPRAAAFRGHRVATFGKTQHDAALNLASVLMDLCPEVRSALYLVGTDFVLRGREIVDGFHPPLLSPRPA